MTAVVTLSGSIYGNFLLEKGDGFVIGRSLQADMSVDDLRVSRRHCRIVHEERGVTATDLRSANGTYLNGRRLAPSEESAISDGDKVRFGGYTTSFISVAGRK